MSIHAVQTQSSLYVSMLWVIRNLICDKQGLEQFVQIPKLTNILTSALQSLYNPLARLKYLSSAAPGLLARVFAVHTGSWGFNSYRLVTVVSLNDSSDVCLIKPAKLYMCMQKYYKHNEDGRMVLGVPCHGSVPLSTQGTSLQELDYCYYEIFFQSLGLAIQSSDQWELEERRG